MKKTDEQIAFEEGAVEFPAVGGRAYVSGYVLAALAAARADERARIMFNRRGGMYCACSFDENDVQLHQCGWHLDREKNIKAAARAEQHAECVRLLREECPGDGEWTADWLEARKP